MKNHPKSRRSFLKNTILATGMTAVGASAAAVPEKSHNRQKDRLPREVWISGICQEGIQTDTAEEMTGRMLDFMQRSAIYQPDIICLPEVFPTSNVRKRYNGSERVDVSGKALQQLSAYAKSNHCYVIASVYTYESGNTYNSAVVLDREGKDIGEYRKIHLTEDEIESGLTPGPLDPPVFETDFGKIGIQICFDVLWDDGWSKLKEKGAELVFWPSAYGGGQTLNAKAALHRYIVATSTRKGASKISDFTGLDVAKTGFWDPNIYCAPINLEKAFLHTWPYVQKFNQIRGKYGRKVRITNFHEEEWSVIESLSPEVSIASIMREFDLKTYDQHKHDSEMAQTEARNNLTKK